MSEKRQLSYNFNELSRKGDHDALSYIKGSHGIIVPVPAHSLEREEPDFFGSEIGDMKSATAELSKRNGLEPPKDLNRAH